MALSGVAQYRAAQPVARVGIVKLNSGTIAGKLFDAWGTAPFNGANPTVPVAPTAATLGALGGSPSGVATWLKTFISTSTPGSTFMVFDRLSHQGGLSAIVTGVVTTNLPTAALTRFTSGVGVLMGISIYGTIGTTATTISVSYTNSAGVAGRTSPLLTIGGTNDRNAATFLPLPFQVGDVGVRSIESVTLTGTTGTAGAYGVTLLKPLGVVPTSDLARGRRFDNLRDMGAWFENVPADACLSVLHALSSTAGTRSRAAEFHLIGQV